MAQATAQEVLMLALLNRARLDPAGEALRYGIALNEGLAAGTISTASKQPLAMSQTLNTAADAHSQAMIDSDFFAHTNPNTSSTPQTRGNAAGYSGGVGENIAWRGSTGAIDLTQMIVAQHEDLFVDEDVPGRGHRTNMLSGSYQEVGIGQISGLFLYQGTNYNSSMVTQDFGIPSSATQFLTGITYNDNDGNAFYSVGEARSGVTVSTPSGATTTYSGGDYARAVNAGSQTVTFSGGGMPQTVSVTAVVASGVNALVNLVGPSTIETSVSLTANSGVTRIVGLGNLGLTLTGSSASEVFVSAPGNDTINGGAGADSVQFSGNRAAYTLTDLGGGSVRVAGPSGTDQLTGVETLVFADQSVAWNTQVPQAPHVFASPALALPSFGSSAQGGGWSSQTQYPRLASDVNGDDRADIVGFGSAGVFVALANPDGTFGSARLAVSSFGQASSAGGWSNNDAYHRTVSDVNGDGKADIVGFGGAGVYVSLATSNGNFASATLAMNSFGSDNAAGGWSSDNLYHREVADVNGDGKADIVGFGGAGVYVSLATSNGNFAAPTLAVNSFGSSAAAGGWSSDNQYHRELADVNGDGKADIVGFGGDSTYVALATSNGNFANPVVAINSFGFSAAGGGWATQDQFPRHVADVNGDGRGDVVGFGGDSIYVALGNANGTFTQPAADLASFGFNNGAGGWNSDNSFPRLLADLDGNGAADIVGFGSAGAYVSYSTVDLLV